MAASRVRESGKGRMSDICKIWQQEVQSSREPDQFVRGLGPDQTWSKRAFSCRPWTSSMISRAERVNGRPGRAGRGAAMVKPALAGVFGSVTSADLTGAGQGSTLVGNGLRSVNGSCHEWHSD